MVSLWLPIIAAAVGVFIASAIIHMALPYHRTDVKKLPVEKEDALLDAFARLGVAPDDYLVPHAGGQAAMRDPAFIAKAKKGPRVFFSLGPGEAPAMGPYLAQWFVYCAVVSTVTALLVWQIVGPGGDGRLAFHYGSLISLVAYGMALPQMSIWYRRSWATTLKSLFDSVIYGAVAGGAFAWLWPM
jgi:hypothetical protein